MRRRARNALPGGAGTKDESREPRCGGGRCQPRVTQSKDSRDHNPRAGHATLRGRQRGLNHRLATEGVGHAFLHASAHALFAGYRGSLSTLHGDARANPAFGAVGTSPKIFDRWVVDEAMTLRANAAIWDGSPPLERVIHRFISDPMARFLALQAGAVDVAAALPAAALSTIVTHPELDAMLHEAGFADACEFTRWHWPTSHATNPEPRRQQLAPHGRVPLLPSPLGGGFR